MPLSSTGANRQKDSYVLITPARNEEAYIEKPLQSIVVQTILPKEWVIVSDNSSDRTDDIARSYCRNYDFVRLVRIEGQSQRNFNAKVNAFNVGYQEVKHIDYSFIGILDADVSLYPDYYQRVLKKFRNDKTLGLAGGVRYDLYKGKFEKVLCSRNSVGGPFQLFRRECFEEIGGFWPQKIGGEDAIAEIMARMHGWKVESFPEIKVYHYRWTGGATGNVMRASFLNGEKGYLLGYSPLFQIARCIYSFRQKPYNFNSLFSLIGYFVAMLKRYQRTVPEDYLVYFRQEQKTRLRSLLSEWKARKNPDSDDIN
ncbi:MAG: glycosyltransferase family 2 protein [Candidatus Omnitrophica bacterium]|nr:glycosyltransferase family 2 protein [Candidatus Omnitrophota bacterium]